MPDLLVLLTTLGGLALFGIAGIVIGPIIGALVLVVSELLSKAIDEDREFEELAAAKTIAPEPSKN
jgi:predicted PurR-regulated permease PerM